MTTNLVVTLFVIIATLLPLIVSTKFKEIDQGTITESKKDHLQKQMLTHEHEFASEQNKHDILISELEKQNNELKIILDLIPGGVWFKDTKNRVLKTNKPAATALGFKVEDIEGKSLDDLFPQQAAEAYETDKQVISSKKSLRKIVCLDNIDGEPTWLQREKIPVMNQVNDLYWCTCVHPKY